MCLPDGGKHLQLTTTLTTITTGYNAFVVVVVSVSLFTWPNGRPTGVAGLALCHQFGT